MSTAGPVRVFLSYAHEDHEWRDAVLGQLGWLRHSGQLEVFYDPLIAPGQPWDGRIRDELRAAQIVVVLLSGHFLNSSYCVQAELMPTLERHGRGETALVAVVCRHVELAGTPLGDLQCLPQDPATNDLKPLVDWQDRTDIPLAAVTAKVRGLIEVLRLPVAEMASGPGPETAGDKGLPPRGLFVGRQTDLGQLLAWVLNDDSRPIAVLGPGGIGKSKLTIAALHHERVATHFGDRRLFVRLEEVRDEAGVYAAIAGELGIEAARPLGTRTIAALAAAPTLIVLDNAETPWEADLERGSTAVAEAFARLAEVPGVRFVASLRGFELPGVADWRPLLVEPLPEHAARALFLAAAGVERDRYDSDPVLPKLLAKLDGLPLAIELVAHRAQAEPSAATVLDAWQAERDAFVRKGSGGKKQVDLAASITLSLNGPRMTEPGRYLFAALGRLPHGLARADLDAVMPAEGATAARALRGTGLILRDAVRLRMLGPVREHAAAQPLGDAERDALHAHFAALADALPKARTEPADRSAAQRARDELANIESVLGLAAPDMDPSGSSRSGWRWIRVGDVRRILSAIHLAAAAYHAAHEHFERAANLDPANVERQRDLSVSWWRLGAARATQGDRAGALEAYERAQEIVARLVEADPGNPEWQDDLSSNWGRLGDARQAEGDRAGALEACGRAHEILAKLADADPGGLRWQRDLGSSWWRLGDARAALGEHAGALEAYGAAKDIAERLAALEPGSVAWQRDLASLWSRLGDARRAEGDRAGAAEAYRRICDILAEQADADPGNADWKRDLCVGWERLGDLQRAQGDGAGAMEAYSSYRNVAEGLAALNQGNLRWQHNLYASWRIRGGRRATAPARPRRSSGRTKSWPN